MDKRDARGLLGRDVHEGLLEQVRKWHSESPLDRASTASLRALAYAYWKIDIEVYGHKEERREWD